jgi:8-oxo-dGTP diphosphatase
MRKLGVMILIKKKNSVLLLRRKKLGDTVHTQGVLIPMGGKVEDGEMLVDAAVREVYEESGLKVSMLKLIGVLQTARKKDSGFDEWTNFLFITHQYSGKETNKGEGSFEWVSVDDLPNKRMYKGIRVFLTEALKNDFVVSNSFHREHKLIYSTNLHIG